MRTVGRPSSEGRLSVCGWRQACGGTEDQRAVMSAHSILATWVVRPQMKVRTTQMAKYGCEWLTVQPTMEVPSLI